MTFPKRIILGISGSIAAYKSAALTRLLIRQGAEVQVLMTDAASQFISPLTLSTLSKRPVYSSVISESAWNNHVELGLWADLFVVAPASANTLAKLATGICDNIISAVYLSARCPVLVAPAMDVDMWHHPATQANIEQLRRFGVGIIPVGHGELASGLVGDGRMAEPEDIVAFISEQFAGEKPLYGVQCMVSAGPTHEPIDPVRFIGNHSSGKMGIAIAEALCARGASVDLVLGPTHLRPQSPDIRLHLVQTAQEMHDACTHLFGQSRVAVMAAAVADYRPAEVAAQKIKKKEEDMSIPLVRTPDIAAALGAMKKPGQLSIGFALETDNETQHALDKLKRKNFDLIVLNSLQDEGAGFGHDTNKVSIFHKDGKKLEFGIKSKQEVAADIVDQITTLL